MSTRSDTTSLATHYGARRSPREWMPEGLAPANTAETSRYQPLDPQTLGRLRKLRIGDIELELDGHRLIVRGKPVHLPLKEFIRWFRTKIQGDASTSTQIRTVRGLAMSSTCRKQIDGMCPRVSLRTPGAARE
jgi:hypothetical protein